MPLFIPVLVFTLTWSPYLSISNNWYNRLNVIKSSTFIGLLLLLLLLNLN